MKSIKNNIENEIIINKSKFITLFIKVKNIDEVNINLENIKKKYKDATHYCYAYIIDNIKKASDDGEPSGTAGMPILNVLENNELNYIMCVIVRYFGGIKLGTGGLVRAYTKSVTSCLKEALLEDIKEGYKVELIFNYEYSKIIDILLQDEIILNKIFDENITYQVIINKDNYLNLINKLELGCIKVSIIDLVKY